MEKSRRCVLIDELMRCVCDGKTPMRYKDSDKLILLYEEIESSLNKRDLHTVIYIQVQYTHSEMGVEFASI